jgi:hypothetical protein
VEQDHRGGSTLTDMVDIVEVASFGTAFAADLAVAHLASVGIEAKAVSDDAGGAIPSMTGLSGGARVMVRIEDLERAREALEAVAEDLD